MLGIIVDNAIPLGCSLIGLFISVFPIVKIIRQIWRTERKRCAAEIALQKEQLRLMKLAIYLQVHAKELDASKFKEYYNSDYILLLSEHKGDDGKTHISLSSTLLSSNKDTPSSRRKKTVNATNDSRPFL